MQSDSPLITPNLFALEVTQCIGAVLPIKYLYNLTTCDMCYVPLFSSQGKTTVITCYCHIQNKVVI